jgi:glycosyltransferase involved in cell wall biosynthesis
MRQAANRGHRVLFVETGSFVGKHLLALVRGPGRVSLARRLLGGESVYPGITARKTVNILPLAQRFRSSERVNGVLSRIVVGRAASKLPEPRVIWLYDPRATWAIGAADATLAVYDCVDDYAQQVVHPRGRALVADADRRAASRADLVFTTTKALRERHHRANPKTRLVGNAGDFDHFVHASDRTNVRDDLRGLPGPVLGFAGNFLTGKVDLYIVEILADRYPAGTVLLAGPADAASETPLRALATRPNVRWLGHVPYEELPSVVAAFDVALIPYAANAYTQNVFPLKLFEYLAAGKPVVATGLPELEGMEPDVVVCDPDDLQPAVAAALELRQETDVARRQALARENTWETRATRLLEATADELVARDDRPEQG